VLLFDMVGRHTQKRGTLMKKISLKPALLAVAISLVTAGHPGLLGGLQIVL